MKRKTVRERAEAYAEKSAKGSRYLGVQLGWITAVLELAYLAGYRAAKREKGK